jgi:hypothetical protein
MKNKITKNMSSNFEVKAFSDSQDSLATSNQILINYGISILSIETLFDFFCKEMSNNQLVELTSIESIKNMKIQINDIKSNYFTNLFKHKIENHFFRYFDSEKNELGKDIAGEISKPDQAFSVFFMVVKNLAKSVRLRVNEPKFIFYFVLENQFINFLRIIESLKDLDKLSYSEFNFNKLGVNGLEIIIFGILFVYNAIQKILGLDEEGTFKDMVDKYIDNFISDFGKARNINTERFYKNKQLTVDKVIKYIMENRIELLKGY